MFVKKWLTFEIKKEKLEKNLKLIPKFQQSS